MEENVEPVVGEGGASHVGDASVAPPPTSPPGSLSESRGGIAGVSTPAETEVTDVSNIQEQAEAEHPTVEAQSQPPTATASSTASVKDEEVASGPTPYGTRSRHKTATTRPNYADDDELDREIEMSGMRNPDPKRRSTSSDLPPKSDTNYASDQGSSVNVNSTNGKSQHTNGLLHLSVSDRERSPPRAEHKPRKRKHQDKDASSKSTPGPEAIPGTLTFSALPAGDVPAAKRRRMSYTHANGTEMTRRKHSSNVARPGARETCVFSFEKSGGLLKNGKLIADDGTAFAPDDHVYLICEPPGDPYYLCRIMEFRHIEVDNASSPVVSMLVNWFYRPKDINRYNSDPRYLFASMQSDESPITSLRGKCRIKHRSEIKDLETFRQSRDSFWFAQLYDRYIHRPYEILPVPQVTNVPEKVKKALDERWKFLVVEPARLKELTSAVKLCKRCSQYCAPTDSVECAVCRNTYHMTCVQPPLQKKPSRGFGWSCGPCSKAQERKLKERHAAVIASPDGVDPEEEDVVEEEEEDAAVGTTAPSPNESDTASEGGQGTLAEIAQANMWPWRYLGIHCRVEDVLQYDDRAIYPRASSRLGPRHQANVLMWQGRPVELVKPVDIKKRYVKGSGNKKDAKFSKDTLAAIEADRVARAQRPKWVQDEPAGYVARGEDFPDSDPRTTAERLFVIPEEAPDKIESSLLDKFMDEARSISKALNDETTIIMTEDMVKARLKFRASDNEEPAPKVGDRILTSTTNFLEKAIELLQENDFKPGPALAQLKEVTPKSIGNPDFTKEEIKKFEDSVAKHGSDLRSVKKHVKRPYGQIVRFYYGWKRKPRGREVWGNFEGKGRGKRRVEASWTDIADDEDDSAFDGDKAIARKRAFQCKHCSTRSSRQWRRAPNVAPGATILIDPKGGAKDKANQLVLALCQRCAVMWRRYALKWEDPDELARSIAQSGGRAWRRKNDEEMLREVVAANEIALVATTALAASAAQAIGMTLHVPIIQDPKKKIRAPGEKEGTPMSSSTEGPQKKKGSQVPARQPTPPIVPQQPKLRTLPCAICLELEPQGDQHLTCKECRMSVHRQCYGISEHLSAAKWICDLCLNDKNGQFSISYQCILCPVKDRQVDLLEPPKATHKKKTDRDKEKEAIEKTLSTEFLHQYAKRQEERCRPKYPREAMKRTANNNWVHVTCAVWNPDIKFLNAASLEGAEGMGNVVSTPLKLDPLCRICKRRQGMCVSCHVSQCPAKFHVGCAHDAGYLIGFDVQPVKGSRKDMVNAVTVGTETGSMAAAIWCLDHQQVKTIVHPMHEVVEESGLNALQLYVQTFKQADGASSGTARKANMLLQTVKVLTQSPVDRRRPSIVVNGYATSGKALQSPSNVVAVEDDIEMEQHVCVMCGNEASPKWHLVTNNHQEPMQMHSQFVHTNGERATSGQLPNGHPPAQGYKPLGIGTPSKWKCHKCFVNKIDTPIIIPPKEDVRLANQPGPTQIKSEGRESALQGPLGASYPAQGDLMPPSGPPVAANQSLPGLDPNPLLRPPMLEPRVDQQWTMNLQNTTIWLHRGERSDCMRVKDFGDLNDNQQLIFNHFQSRAADKLGYDRYRCSIKTHTNSEIGSAHVLINVLVELVLNGPREVHWHIIDKDSYPGYPVNGAPHVASHPHGPPLHDLAMAHRSPPHTHPVRPAPRYGSPDVGPYGPHPPYHGHQPYPPRYGHAERPPPPHSRPPIPPHEPQRPRTPPAPWPPHYGPHNAGPAQHTPGPPPPMPHPQHPPSRSQYPTEISSSSASPYYSHGAALQLTESFAPSHPGRTLTPREGSPAVRPITPRSSHEHPAEGGAAAPASRPQSIAPGVSTPAAGASSSPRVQNLLH